MQVPDGCILIGPVLNEASEKTIYDPRAGRAYKITGHSQLTDSNSRISKPLPRLEAGQKFYHYRIDTGLSIMAVGFNAGPRIVLFFHSYWKPNE